MYVVTDRRDLRDRRDRARIGGPKLALLTGGEQRLTGQLAGSKGEVVTFTRATPKYASDGSAQLASGQPLVEANGLLIEAAHTNLMTHGEDLTDWAATGDTVPTSTANFAAAPDGTNHATKVVIGACTNAQESKFYQAFTASASKYTFSIWAQAITAGAQMVVAVQDPGGTVYSAKITPTATWTRFVFTTPVALTAGTAYAVFGWISGQGAHALASSLVWRLQMTVSAYALSDITGTGTATCNADVATLPSTNLPIAAGAVEFDFMPLWSVPSVSAYLLANPDAGHANSGLQLLVLTNGTLDLVIANSSGFDAISHAASWIPGQRYRIRVTWGGGNAAIYRDGALLVSGSGLHMPDFVGALQIGSSSGSNQCDGWISNLHFEG